MISLNDPIDQCSPGEILHEVEVGHDLCELFLVQLFGDIPGEEGIDTVVKRGVEGLEAWTGIDDS